MEGGARHGATESSRAGTWFDVRIHYQQVSRRRTAWHVLRHLGLAFLTLGLVVGTEFDPPRPCQVVVSRLDTGQAVASYRYRLLSDGEYHLQSLLRDLKHLHVYDFCRALGISPDHVEGSGSVRPVGYTTELWVGHPRDEWNRLFGPK